MKAKDKWLCVLAFALVAIGFVIIFTHSVVFNAALSFSQHSLLFKLWLLVPFKTSLDFYFFNWTNPEDIRNSSVKPRVQEVGPYRYWQTDIKENITWNENGTITFRQHNIWHYDSTFGNASLDDNITTVNLVTLMAAHLTRNWNSWFRRGVFVPLSGVLGGLTMTHTPRELIFDGYEEAMLKVGHSMPFFFDANLPNWDKFGFYYNRNDSSEYQGVLNMDVTAERLGQAHGYNYDNKTNFYEGECGKVEGSFAHFFPRNPSQDSIKVFFLESHMRNSIAYVENETVRGILGYKYDADDRMLDNGTIFKENQCFCNGECVPSGLLNLSSVRYGMPVFGSLPHFYRADPYFLELVEGLRPNPDKHGFVIVIEPNTGIPIKIDTGFQVNLLLQPISGTRFFDDIPRLFLPVLWLNQKMEMTTFAVVLMQIIVALPTICRCLGFAMIVTGCLLLIYVRRRRQRMKLAKSRINKLERRVHSYKYDNLNSSVVK